MTRVSVSVDGAARSLRSASSTHFWWASSNDDAADGPLYQFIAAVYAGLGRDDVELVPVES